MNLFDIATKHIEYIFSIPLFFFIIYDLLKIFRDLIILAIKRRKSRDEKEKKSLRQTFLINIGFLLPWEIMSLVFTIIFTFFIFHWFTSSTLVLSLTGLLFKQVVSEIPYIILSAIYSIVKKPRVLKPDIFTEETGMLPPNFPCAIYIPQKAKSIEDVYAAIGQGLRALRNNSSNKNSPVFIYHSDTEDPILVKEEIRLILEAREEFGNRVFLFCRNKSAYSPFFLKKPGGYMSDYQIFTHDIWHPLTYITNTFDGRIQKILRRGKIEDLFPFYPDTPADGCQFFIRYRKNLFVKERFIFEKTMPSEEKFRREIKITSKEYLVNQENPLEHYLINQGEILTPEQKVVLKSDQWKIDTSGKIEVIPDKHGLFARKNFSFVFVNVITFEGNKKLFLDKMANLVDPETGKIWARREDYSVKHEFSLYRHKNGAFELLQENVEINKRFFLGEDYRRLIFDRFNAVPQESLDELIKDGLISPFEARQAIEKGLVGDIYSLHIAKNGDEEEFFIEDAVFALKEKVTGGYLVRKSDGFNLDEEGNLLYKNLLVEPKENLNTLSFRQDNGGIYLAFEENGIKYFLKDSLKNKKIPYKDDTVLFYIKNPWINKTKPAKDGFIVNSKDGFILDADGSLWFGTYINQPTYIKIADKERAERLNKEDIFIDYTDNSCLKRRRLIGEAGSWYKTPGGAFYKRKLIASRDFVHFNENLDAVVFSPMTGEKKVYLPGSYSLGRNYLWSKEEGLSCKITSLDDIREYKGNLISEEIIALTGQYRFNSAGCVTIDAGILPYGTYLRFDTGDMLRDHSGNFIYSDSCLKIINQTDSDAEFQPLTINYINSRLIRNLWDDSPYLMYQPEISFANQGQSIFSRFNSWAQQIYRFTGRAFFNAFGESSAYGKMTKLIEAYVLNIVYKEAIPPLARTHDHWEAMHLKTALILSHPSLKAKNLIENIPPNFFSFLKRQEGWIGGDLVLLEHESSFGVALDYLRAGLSLLKFDPDGFRFWINYSRRRIRYLKERPVSPSHLAKLFRIWMINRLIFCPFYYGIWLMLVGSFSLIVPGTLTVKSTELSWILFWSTLGILIVLSKVIVPFLERFLFYEEKKIKFFIILAATVTAITINMLGETISPLYWKWLNSCILVSYLIYQLVINRIIPFLFYSNKNILLSLKRIVVLAIIFAVGWLYLPVIFEYLSEFPSANWIFIFTFDIVPRLSGYLVSWVVMLLLFPSGKTLLNLLKKSIFETIYSSSILLLNIIYVPLTVFNKILIMIFHPNRSISWVTSSSVEKLLKHKLSLEESYAHLFWAPFFSVVFIILPVIFGFADASLLFYGWPVFIWSWLMGPYLAWFSGNFGEVEEFSSLEFLAIKDKLYRWKEECRRDAIQISAREIINKILKFNLHIRNGLSKRELLRLYLYILTDAGLEDTALRDALNRNLKTEISPENLREYNWLTLNEISRARIILKLEKSKITRTYLKNWPLDTGLIKSCLLFISRLGPHGLRGWEKLPNSQKLKMFYSVSEKYSLPEESRKELKMLIQLFTRKEMAVLYEKMRGLAGKFLPVDAIPEEFVYLKMAVKELNKITDWAGFSLHRRKNVLEQVLSKYFICEKDYLRIFEPTLKIKK